MTKKTTSLPVLMYHYINRWPDPISVSPERFAAQCEALSRNGWKGVSLAEAEAYLLHGESLPPKSCLITFDDGYLDNYVHAWPILHKYGHKGVIFAVSGRLEAPAGLRPTLADTWKDAPAPAKVAQAEMTRTEMTPIEMPPKEMPPIEMPPIEMPRVDEPFIRHPNGYEVRADLFCNWDEAREMEKSGVMSLASHSLGHQGVCINDDYDGFFLPGRRGRTFHTPQPFFWGMPRFVMGPGLLERAFLPDPDLTEKIMRLVPQDEEEAFAFAASAANMAALQKLAANAPSLGRMETDAEMAARMEAELRSGKERLEKELGRPETSLCWPWGAYSPLALEIGRGLGYRVFFTTRAGANPPKAPLAVRRFKAKDKDAAWLLRRVGIYASPLLAGLYAALQFRSLGGRSKKRKAFVIRRQQGA